MEEVLKGLVPEAAERRRSWRGATLVLSLAAHAGLAAMLWVDQPPQPAAGAVVSIEIVSAAGAASASASSSGASPARAPAEVARPERAPVAAAMTAPDAPRAAREPPHEARPQEQRLQRETSAMPAPPETAATPSAAFALRRPARIPPPPVKTPRLAAPSSTAKRASENGRATSQTASVPLVAADAAPGAAAPGAGPESGITPPRYGFGSAANPIPRYPETARENGWEGVVMLSVSVGAGGEALSVSVLKSSGHGLLDASAVDAVRRWRFEPARRAGVPIPGTAIVPIRFRLEE